MVLQPLEIRPPWYILLDYYTTRLTFEMRPLVAELKLKMSQTEQFLSPPVLMHGGLICITLCPDVTGEKVRLEIN